MKADEKVITREDGMEQKEKYTNFEYLRHKVEVLQEQLERVASILDQQDMVLKIEESACFDIEEELYNRLEE